VTLLAGEQVASIPESALAVTLLQGISRSNRMDTAIQKATELGVAEIRPVVTKRSVVQLDERRAARRLSHWQQIAISACEQCGRDTVPHVLAPVPLDAAIADRDLPATRILLHAGANGGLTDIPPPDMKLALIAGPEGGLTEGEITECEAHRFVQAGLGPRILRTETAPLAALAILQYRFGDLV
jgi:16S rRNA (uracil1498-N3)-methyltransferase